jgi:beta-lactamase regulating signal transducer with metallopeptidase domain
MAGVLGGITILLLAAYCLTLALRRNSAAVRHVVWTCAIIATLLFAPLRWIAPQRMVNGTLPRIFTPTLDVHGTANGGVGDLVTMAIALWIMGGAAVALRLFVSSARLRRIVLNADVVGTAGSIPIACSPLVPGPLVAGILRPVILLPIDASTWTPSRRRAVLAHELAHVRRRDPLVLLPRISQLFCTGFIRFAGSRQGGCARRANAPATMRRFASAFCLQVTPGICSTWRERLTFNPPFRWPQPLIWSLA